MLSTVRLVLIFLFSVLLSFSYAASLSITDPSNKDHVSGALSVTGSKVRRKSIRVLVRNTNTGKFWNASKGRWQRNRKRNLIEGGPSRTWSFKIPAGKMRPGHMYRVSAESGGESVGIRVNAVDSDALPQCIYPTGGTVQTVDFSALKASGESVSSFNMGGRFVRTVFELGQDRMRWGPEGLQLAFDVGGNEQLDYTFRAEFREDPNDIEIPAGSTHVYCMRFSVDKLPPIYGPVTIFQRFDRNVDGPDVEVELTGLNQFFDAEANDIQVVSFDGRHRIGKKLVAGTTHTLMVVVHTHRSNGSYKVVLNGDVLREGSNLNTKGARAGSWPQFGLYPHGFYGDSKNDQNRKDQKASGKTAAQLEYFDFTMVTFRDGPSNLDSFDVSR